jgi:hypothetical protein
MIKKLAPLHRPFCLPYPDIIPDAVELDEIVIMGNPSSVRISGFARSDEAVAKLQKDIIDTALLTDIKNDVKTSTTLSALSHNRHTDQHPITLINTNHARSFYGYIRF